MRRRRKNIKKKERKREKVPILAKSKLTVATTISCANIIQTQDINLKWAFYVRPVRV